MDTNRHECKRDCPLITRIHPKNSGCSLLSLHSRHSRVNLLFFVSISVHSWLGRCLSARGQRRTQMPNFVFYVARIFDGLRDFLADEPAITTPQIVKLFFNRGLCYRQGSSQILIRNICAIRSKIKAQRLKQSEPASALAFLAQTPKRLFDYRRSPTQIEQLLGRPRIERLRRDR